MTRTLDRIARDGEERRSTSVPEAGTAGDAQTCPRDPGARPRARGRAPPPPPIAGSLGGDRRWRRDGPSGPHPETAPCPPDPSEELRDGPTPGPARWPAPAAG